MSAQLVKTIGRRNTFIGTPYWYVERLDISDLKEDCEKQHFRLRFLHHDDHMHHPCKHEN